MVFIAVSEIKDRSMVRDAAYSRKNDTYNLAIIVDYAISEEYAKRLGDNFVRLIKSMSDDESPGKEIGSGKYNYLIGVYFPNEKEVVMGAKANASKKIIW